VEDRASVLTAITLTTHPAHDGLGGLELVPIEA
jgi:hypothetical protein